MAILRRMAESFSFDIRPVKALDARTRTRRLLCVEHLLMNGISKKGSNKSPLSLAIVEGLSLDKRINMGHKLGCTALASFDPTCSGEPFVSNSVAIFSSLYKKGCNDGYLQKRKQMDNLKYRQVHPSYYQINKKYAKYRADQKG